MDAFIDQFTLYDVFMVALGLVIATLGRIYYDSYKERKLIKALSEKVKVYNQSINTYDEGVLILAHDRSVLFVSQGFADYLGRKTKEITQEFLENLIVHPIDDPDRGFAFFDLIERRKTITDIQLPGVHNPVPVKISSNLFYEDDASDAYWRIVIVHDMSEYYRLQKQVQKNHSYHDLLTNLPVYGQLIGDLVEANVRANVEDTTDMLVFLGIKHFPARRLVLGFDKTNQMIKLVAELLKKNLRDYEKLYYRGQGDFALFLSDIKNAQIETDHLQTLLDSIKEILISHAYEVDFSMAVLVLNRHKLTPDAIVDRCHELQLDSERLGRTVIEDANNPSLSHEDVPTTMIRVGRQQRHFTKSDFTNAIQRKEFFSYYQPMFDLKTDKLIGAEYLMRWNHPKYGLLNASEFLDKAVQLNVLTEITDYLLETVLSHKASWDNFGIQNFRLSINFAMPELRIVNFAKNLEDKLFEHVIDPDTITIDLSERLLSEGDTDIIEKEIAVLKRMGVQTALESFGESFMHLKLLDKLNFDTIKIDRSLTQGIENNPEKRKLVSAIVAMGRGLNVTVGATHIDSETARDTLRSLGCDYGQGYFYSKALPFFEMFKFIQTYQGIKIDQEIRTGV